MDYLEVMEGCPWRGRTAEDKKLFIRLLNCGILPNLQKQSPTPKIGIGFVFISLGYPNSIETCCFTGHRVIRPDQMDMVLARTETKIRELIVRHGVRYFGMGGALGYDTLVANILFRLRDTEFPQIKVILVYPFEGFRDRWVDKQKATCNRNDPPVQQARLCGLCGLQRSVPGAR